MSDEREAIVRWLLEVSDDWPWTGRDIAGFILHGCKPWPDELRRDPAELELLVTQVGDHLAPKE